VPVNALYGNVDSGIDHTRGYGSLFAATSTSGRAIAEVSLDAEHILKRVNEPGVFRYVRLPRRQSQSRTALRLPPLPTPAQVRSGWRRIEPKSTISSSPRTGNLLRRGHCPASYGSSHLVRDRHFNTIDLEQYGANPTAWPLESIGLQPGAPYDNSNDRAEIAGALNLGSTNIIADRRSQNIRDAFTSTTTAALARTTPRHRACRAFKTLPSNRHSGNGVPSRRALTRVERHRPLLFRPYRMSRWLLVLAACGSDYTQTNLDRGALTFGTSRPPSLTAWSSGLAMDGLYVTYIEGLESTPAAPSTVANVNAKLPAATARSAKPAIKIEPRHGLLIAGGVLQHRARRGYINAPISTCSTAARASCTSSVSTRGDAGLVAVRDWQFLDAKQISGEPTGYDGSTSTAWPWCRRYWDARSKTRHDARSRSQANTGTRTLGD